MEPNNTLKGIVLMTGGMACFAVADSFIKLTAGTMSPAHTTFLLMGGGLIVFTAIALLEGQKLWNKDAFNGVLMIRYVAEMVGAFGMVLALSTAPLSTVGAVAQAAPLLIVAGAALFLKEKVGWRRWAAIFVGFFGVLLIVQPGSGAFDPGLLWVVFSVFGFAARDLLTKLAPANIPSSSMSSYTMLAAMPFATAWCLISEGSVLPETANWGYVLGMIGFGSIGYMSLIASMRIAPMSIVAPFRYTRLIFLLFIGILIFGEQPNALMLIGAALVLGSGGYTMLRDRKLKQASSS